MKVLVTGGAGFIGSHVAEAYAQAGHEVVVIDNLSTGRLENVPAGVRFVAMDVTSEDLRELFEREQFDVVNHHAAHMELRVSVEKPLHDAAVNILGSINVMESAMRTSRPHVILGSTSAVLGELHQFPADEEHPAMPIAPYGVSKRAVELYADYYRMTHGLTITTLRYTNVYGPRQNPFGESGVMAIFLHKHQSGEQCRIHGDGSQVRDYIYVSDVAAANLTASDHRLNETYMVCTSTEASVLDVVLHLEHALGERLSVEHGPAKAGDPARTLGSYQRLHRATGWKPTMDLASGIVRTVASFRK